MNKKKLVGILTYALIVLVILDVGVTFYGLNVGIAEEANPIVNYFIDHFGITLGLLIPGAFLVFVLLHNKSIFPQTYEDKLHAIVWETYLALGLIGGIIMRIAVVISNLVVVGVI